MVVSRAYLPAKKSRYAPVDRLFGRYTELEVGEVPSIEYLDEGITPRLYNVSTTYHTGRYNEYDKQWEPGITIQFEIEGGSDDSPDKAIIKLFNIQQEKAKLFGVGSPIVLRSGYFTYYDNIFLGVVSFKKTYRSGQDIITEFECTDSTELFLNKVIARYIPGSPFLSTIVLDICQTFNIPIGFIDARYDDKWEGDYNYSGAIRDHFDELKGDRYKYYFKSGLLYFVRNDSGIPTGLAIDVLSGLLEVRPAKNQSQPTPTEEGTEEIEEDDPVKNVTHKLKALLIPGISTDTVFRVYYETPWYPNRINTFLKVISFKYMSSVESHIVEADCQEVRGPFTTFDVQTPIGVAYPLVPS